MKIKLTMMNPTKAQLNLSYITGDEYVFIDLDKQEIHSTSDVFIYKISNNIKDYIKKSLQGKFVEVLKSI